MILLICGSRDWTDEEKVRREVMDAISAYPDLTIIHGDARGADRMGGRWADRFGMPEEHILARPANWDKHGKQAGRIRNLEMLCEAMSLATPAKGYEYGAYDGGEAFPDLLVLAFYKGEFSPGTQMMIDYARRFGVNVKVVHE